MGRQKEEPQTSEVRGQGNNERASSGTGNKLPQPPADVKPLDHIRDALYGHNLSDGSVMARCPAHDDRTPSLHLTADGDKLLVHCLAGCNQEDVIRALRDRGLWPGGNGDTPTTTEPNLPPGIPGKWYGAPYVAHWTYRDSQGQVIGHVARYDGQDGKQVVPFFRAQGSDWRAGAAPAPRPLYGLERVAQQPELPVMVTEGEKAADAAGWLLQGKYVAVSWPGGTNAANKVYWSPLADRDVVIWPDADEPGHKAAQVIAKRCQEAGAKSVAVVGPPTDVPEGWDLADAVEAGWTPLDVQGWIAQHGQGLEQKTKAGFGLIRACDLECKPPDWLVRGYLEADSLAVAFGDPEAGKSFLGLGLGCCIATGQDFYSLPVKSGPVIYLAGEGRSGIARRLRAWEIRNGLDLSTAPFFISTGPAALCDPESAAQVLTAVDQVGKDNSPKLVVIDTLARNFGPGDENSTKDMSAAIQAMDAIRTRYRCTVLMIHHTGHGDKNRARGAMALKGALDAEYRLDKDESGIVRLTPVKMKEAELPEPMAFRIRQVELGIRDEDGGDVTSAILDRVDYEPPASNQPRAQGKWQQLGFRELYRLQQERRQYLQQTGRNPDNAGVPVNDWAQACKAAGMPSNRLSELKRQLRIKEMHIYPD